MVWLMKVHKGDFMEIVGNMSQCFLFASALNREEDVANGMSKNGGSLN